MPRMVVHLVTPERKVWRGEVRIVVARGSEGEVGILPGHAPMLIQLGIAPIFIHPTEGDRVAAAVDGGFLHVTSSGDESRVDVLAEHAELAHEVDVERARRMREDAERRAQERDDAEALADIAKATARLELGG